MCIDMKRRYPGGISLAIIMVLLVVLAGCVFTGRGNESPARERNQGDSFTIYTEELPPLNYIDEQGNVAGRSTEIVQEIMERLHVRYPIHVVPWSTGYRATLTTPGTAIYSTIRTHEREQMFKWVGPVAEIEYSYYTRSGNPHTVHTLSDLGNFGKIAVVRDDAREQYLISLNFTNILPLDDEAACIRALSSGEAEFWLGTRDMYTQNAKRTMWDNTPEFTILDLPPVIEQVYIAFNRDIPDETIEAWQEALDEIKQDGTYDTIQTRYMPYICSWVPCST